MSTRGFFVLVLMASTLFGQQRGQPQAPAPPTPPVLQKYQPVTAERLKKPEDGKYIAVLSGWGGDSRGDQNTLNRLFPGEFPEVPEGGALWVFAIE